MTDTKHRLHHAIEAWASTRSAVHSAALNAVVDSVCIELEMLRLEVASQAESLGAAGETIAQLQAQVRDAAAPAVLQALEDLTTAYRHLVALDGAWDQPLIRAAAACPGQWEPGCDLGANPAHARVAPAQGEPVALTDEQIDALIARNWGDVSIAPQSVRQFARQVLALAAPKAAQGEPVAPSVEAAHAMGAKGGPVVEAERLAFEAWMAGHCWALSSKWTGTEYRSDGEHGGWPDPQAMATRRLWAAWRDRAALSAAPKAAPPANYDRTTCPHEAAINDWQLHNRDAVPAVAQGEPVAYVDKDQPNNVAWCPGFPDALPDISRLYAEPVAPSVEAAHAMGAAGGPVVEAERLAFEAWMAGHCWALSSKWTGTEYRSDGEHGGWPDPQAMATRRLWAAWRDRAALSATPKAAPPQPEPCRYPSCQFIGCPAGGCYEADAAPKAALPANYDRTTCPHEAAINDWQLHNRDAAPDLLAAPQAYVSADDECMADAIGGDTRNAARAAINKATAPEGAPQEGGAA